MKRRISKEIDGEIVLVDEYISAYCSCCSDSGFDLHKVPTTPDPEGTQLCGLCGSYVVWTNQEEISNNGRR